MKIRSQLALSLYRVLTTLTAPLGALWISCKKRRDPPYGSRIFELLGYYKHTLPDCIWFHAASVGEVMSVRPLLEAFRARHPNERIVLTTLTTTGMQAGQKIPGITVLYAPLDSPLAVSGLFSSVHPKMLVLIDTELWPVMLDLAAKNHCCVMMVNARMQEKNCRKYERWPQLSADLLGSRLGRLCCITDEDASRFARIGVPADRLCVTGNLKYDLHPDEKLFSAAAKIKQHWARGPVLGCISTHEGEEEMLLECFFTMQKTISNLSLVLVPRHQSGVARAAQFLKHLNVRFCTKSTLGAAMPEPAADILLGATMGEIEFYFGLCDLLIMGGSFVPVGGHNPLEPAFFSLPVITGPYYHNFKEQYDRLISIGGAFLANDNQRLYALVTRLLNTRPPQQSSAEAAADPLKPDLSLLAEAGVKALEIQQEGHGALERTLKELDAAVAVLRQSGSETA